MFYYCYNNQLLLNLLVNCAYVFYSKTLGIDIYVKQSEIYFLFLKKSAQIKKKWKISICFISKI